MNCFVEYVCSSLELADSKPSVALALACILIDASAEKHYLKTNSKTGGNREMYNKFVKDHQSIILSAGDIKLITPGIISFGGLTIEDIIYKDIRCALLHDADQKIIISNGISGVQGGQIYFCDLIRGLVNACVLAECNSDITSKTNFKINLNKTELNLDNCWGKIDLFRSTLETYMVRTNQ